MHAIYQLQDVESHYSDNGCNLRIDSGSLLTNAPLCNNNNPMSQKAFLNIIPKKRRSIRRKKSHINPKVVLWECKCCGQADIENTKTNCTRYKTYSNIREWYSDIANHQR